MVEPKQTLWALTTYYNPAHYCRRLSNYRTFRRHLQVPLITVELGYRQRFELDCNDADVLVQIPGESVLWQKERLLNIALSRVPGDVEFVAWLDCDILFERGDWYRQASRLLSAFHLVQLFENMFDLGREAVVAESIPSAPCSSPTGVSVSSLVATNSWHLEDFRPPTTAQVRRSLFGLAWAGRRDLLEKHGFYDAMILGSGDRAMACAGYGRFEDAIHTASLDEKRISHYLHWAEPYYEDVRGNMGVVQGHLFHLWHGEIEDRRYIERHRDLAGLAFDPYQDIALDDCGCWRWATQKPTLHAYVNDYFYNRKEDGVT